MGGGSIGFLSAYRVSWSSSDGKLGQTSRRRATFTLTDGHTGILGLLPYRQLKVPLS
jgi:hypothetical protein